MGCIWISTFGFILGLATYHAIRSLCRGLIRFGNALEVMEDSHRD